MLEPPETGVYSKYIQKHIEMNDLLIIYAVDPGITVRFRFYNS